MSFLRNKKSIWRYTAKFFDIEFLDIVVVNIKRNSEYYKYYIIEGTYYHGLDFIYEVYSRFLSKETPDSTLDGSFNEKPSEDELYDCIAFSAYTSEKIFQDLAIQNKDLDNFWSILAILGNKLGNVEYFPSTMEEMSSIEKWLAKVGTKERSQSYLEINSGVYLYNIQKFDKHSRTDLVGMFLLWQFNVSLSDCESKAQNVDMVNYLQKVRQVFTL